MTDADALIGQVEQHAANLRQQAADQRAEADDPIVTSADVLDWHAAQADRAIEMYREALARHEQQPDEDAHVEHRLAALRAHRGAAVDQTELDEQA